MDNNPFFPISDSELNEMLKTIGVSSIDDLFSPVPEKIKSSPSSNLPNALNEFELARTLNDLAGKNGGNKVLSFLGGGCYEHFIPTVVRHLSSRPEFLTSYTPYQPEVSQGSLQAFFEYQTFICRLMNLPVSNASLYDGASALAESAFLALSQQHPKTKIIVSQTVHPEYISVLKTYLKNSESEIEIIKHSKGLTAIEDIKKLISENKDKIAAVIIQNPNFFGCIEDMEEISAITHEAGSLFISIVDPISLGIISAPGDYNADIAIAEGQPLGLDTYLGGDSLGIFACKEDFLKKVPGRLVGITKDKEGRRAFVLTLQTREQHIRRDKATSNICSNQALNAIRASIYLACMGSSGLSKVAQTCADGVQYAIEKFSSAKNIEIPFKNSNFQEFVIKLKKGNVSDLISNLTRSSVYPGINLEQYYPEMENCLLISVTETKTKSDVDYLVQLINTYLELQ